VKVKAIGQRREQNCTSLALQLAARTGRHPDGAYAAYRGHGVISADAAVYPPRQSRAMVPGACRPATCRKAVPSELYAAFDFDGDGRPGSPMRTLRAARRTRATPAAVPA
jgi:hypothetical protein